MGSLVRRNNSRILIAVAVFVLFGLLSPPSWAGSNIEGRKIQLLELLGLDGADPAVVKAAQEAHTLYGVDVVPGQDAMSVILKLSEAPDYKLRFDEEKKRLVVDLSNTINLSPSPLQSLSVDDPVMQVRNSQYQVNPMLVSRVVLDLKDAEQPGVAVDGSNIVITTSRGQSETEVAAPETKNMPAGEVVAVPAVAVDTASPKMDSTFSHAEVSSKPAAQMKHAQPAMAKSIAAQEPPAKEIVLVSQAATAEPKTEKQSEASVASETPENTAPEEPAAEDAIADLIQKTAPAEPVQEETAPAKEAAASEVTIEPQIQMVEVPVKIEPKPKAPALEAKPASESKLAAAGATDEVSKKDDLVTLAFRDADLSAVLDILARKGDLNILAGKDVRGTVTVRLVDVPFDVALNAVLNVNGYGYIKTDNIIRVLPLKELGSPVETRTETFTLSYAQAKNAKNTLKTMLSSNGTIETDDRTNMLIVTDVPAKVEEIRSLIPQMDRRVQQVLIEVLILDSALRDSTDLGISWNLTDNDDDSPTPFAGGGNDRFGVVLPKAIGGLDVNVGTLLDGTQLNILVQALTENTDSRILANPKILTVDNESASIEIVEEFPYNDVTQTSSGGQLSNITFKEIGTKLEVKPQVTHDEHVILWISPEQNSLAGETITGVPIVDTRRAETTLVVRNHQTVVLGGLRENRRMKNLNKVPFLGDLPGVKYAFRNVGSSDQDTELLVFLTVHIVESPPLLASDEIKFDELANMPRKTSVEMDIVR